MPTPGDSVKIILADDSITMHRAVALALKKENLDLICCDNGQDGLRLSLEHQPAILLADLDMPGLTGIELCQAVKNHPSLQKTKVILLCGSFDQVDEGRLESVPADGRLWKPFESHVLITLVQKMLAEVGIAPGSLSSGDLRQSSEATRPLPSAPRGSPPPPPRSILEERTGARDMAADMTQETFRNLEEPAVNSPEQTAPLVMESVGEFRQSPPLPNSPTSPTQGSGLWDPDFKVSEEATAPLAKAKTKPNPPQAPTLPGVPTKSLEKTRVSDMSRLKELRASEKTAQSQVASSAPALNSEELRKMVREEVDAALRGWFSAKLHEKLSEVIAEIDRD